jgi:hypothetical protein
MYSRIRQLAVTDRDGEDPVVLERLGRGFGSPRSETDDQNPVAPRYELPGFRGRFHRLGCRLKQIRQPRVPAVRTGQRPVLARDDPLQSFGSQRQQTPLSPRPIAAKKSFTVWTFFSVLIGISPFASDPIACVASLPVGTSCSSVEFDQVLKDQLTPAISERLD